MRISENRLPVCTQIGQALGPACRSEQNKWVPHPFAFFAKGWETTK